jgi:hypothetical protein
VKPDKRRPIDMNAKGGGHLANPRINKNRADIGQVAAYTPGHKGAKKPKAGKWY